MSVNQHNDHNEPKRDTLSDYDIKVVSFPEHTVLPPAFDSMNNMNNINNYCDTCESETKIMAESMMQNNVGKVYVVIYAGMGCEWYAKRDNIGQPITLFFMHSDSWGQYGEETSHVPKLDEFRKEYQLVKKYNQKF